MRMKTRQKIAIASPLFSLSNHASSADPRGPVSGCNSAVTRDRGAEAEGNAGCSECTPRPRSARIPNAGGPSRHRSTVASAGPRPTIGRGHCEFPKIRTRQRLTSRCRRLVRLEEVAHPVDRPRLQFRRVLPGIDRDVRIRRQRCDVDGGLVGVCGGIVRQDQHRRRAIAHELPRHAVDEVGPDFVEAVQILLRWSPSRPPAASREIPWPRRRGWSCTSRRGSPAGARSVGSAPLRRCGPGRAPSA